jgi:hypothetical protein
MEEQRRKAMKQMALYNQLLKESDDIYRVYAKNCNCRKLRSGSSIASGRGKERLSHREKSATIGFTRRRR